MSIKKENLENNLENQERNLQNIKYLENNGENHFKNIARKNLIIKEKMLREMHQKTKVDANIGNVENYDITVMNVKRRKKTFILWGENKEEDLESILSFDSENDNNSSESDTK